MKFKKSFLSYVGRDKSKIGISNFKMINLKIGFTLVEMITVIAIIGILSTVVFASLSSGKKRARIAAAQKTMQALSTSLYECFYGDVIPLANVRVPASPDSINGGGGFVCSNTSLVTTRYMSLPTGWVFCDGVASGTCDVDSIAGNSSNGSSYWIGAQGDSRRIWCTINGCSIYVI